MPSIGAVAADLPTRHPVLVCRRLEELPSDAQVLVLLLVDRADRQLPAGPARTTLQWFDTTDTLQAALAKLQLPEGEGFAWAAGEASAMAVVRPLLVAKGLPKEAITVAAYWKAGATAFHETLEA